MVPYCFGFCWGEKGGGGCWWGGGWGTFKSRNFDLGMQQNQRLKAHFNDHPLYLTKKKFYLIEVLHDVLFFICKQHMHPVGHEPTISPSTLLLQGEGASFELEFIGKFYPIFRIHDASTKSNTWRTFITTQAAHLSLYVHHWHKYLIWFTIKDKGGSCALSPRSNFLSWKSMDRLFIVCP